MEGIKSPQKSIERDFCYFLLDTWIDDVTETWVISNIYDNMICLKKNFEKTMVNCAMLTLNGTSFMLIVMLAY